MDCKQLEMNPFGDIVSLILLNLSVVRLLGVSDPVVGCFSGVFDSSGSLMTSLVRLFRMSVEVCLLFFALMF